MDRGRLFSFGLPLVGLLITVSELVRLSEARQAADACVTQAEGSVCPAAPDLFFFVVAVAFGLIFLGRLVFLAYHEYRRSGR